MPAARTTPTTVGPEGSEAQADVVVEFRRSKVLEGFEIGDELLSSGVADAPVGSTPGRRTGWL